MVTTRQLSGNRPTGPFLLAQLPFEKLYNDAFSNRVYFRCVMLILLKVVFGSMAD